VPEKRITENDVKALFNSLDADLDDEHLRLNSVYVKRVDGLSVYDVTKIFAEFNPSVVRSIDDSSCIVRFEDPERAALMLLGMSKPLRRVRTPKKAEDGELISDEEEEEGQVKEEGGEDVAVVRDGHVKQRAKLLRSNEVVEVDIEKILVPPGKWRALTKHVPEERLILVRIATGFDVRRSVLYNPARIYTKNEQDEVEESDNVWSSKKSGKIRPGLNLFDEKGNELEWDYEHDTRFFDKRSPSPIQDGNNSVEQPENNSKATETDVGGIKIKTRGRGAKKFLLALADESDED